MMESIVTPGASSTTFSLHEPSLFENVAYGILAKDTNQEPIIKISSIDSNVIITPEQTPVMITPEEHVLKNSLFGTGRLQVQFTKIHCTTCNVHLGSAPINQTNRYVHPLLNVIICKTCFDFYTSGEFEKDEDGSELYCRWCGQGGTVICCSSCIYVFCCKCIRKNHGKRRLAKIRQLDEWLCFVCNPEQMSRLKVLCYSLYEFTLNEIQRAKDLNDPSILEKDHTLCCVEKEPNKRCLELDNDLVENNKKKFKPNHEPLEKLVFSEEKDEVVCTPDLSSLMDLVTSPGTGLSNFHQDHTYTSKVNDILFSEPLTQKKSINKRPTQSNLMKPMQKLTEDIGSSNFGSPNTSQELTFAPPPLVPINCQVQPLNKVIKVANISNQIVQYADVNTDWFSVTANEIRAINNEMSIGIMNLLQQKERSTTVTQLTTIHNKLQELLSCSINGFYNIRKNLKTSFLNNMTNNRKSVLLQVHNKPYINTNGNKAKQSPAKHVQMPFSKPRLKVKTLEELRSVPTECIVIPDDTEPEPPSILESVLSKNNENNPPKSEAKAIEDVEDKEKSEYNGKEFDPIIVRLIKYAMLESKIDQIMQSNITVANASIEKEELKKMISVRVVLQTDYSSGTLRTNPKRFYKPMCLKEYETEISLEKPVVDDINEDIEELLGGSILLKTKPSTESNLEDVSSFVTNKELNDQILEMNDKQLNNSEQVEVNKVVDDSKQMDVATNVDDSQDNSETVDEIISLDNSDHNDVDEMNNTNVNGC